MDQSKMLNKNWKKYTWLKISITITSTIVCLGVIFVIAAPKINKETLPDLESFTKYKPLLATRVYAENGELVGEFAIEQRVKVPLRKIPKKLIEAVIAVEDKKFYRHSGIDIMRMIKAAWKNLLAGKIVEGGSTIPQQVAKLLYTSRERTLRRKIKDMYLAIELSRRYTKEQILEVYLNEIYLGHGAYGVEAAANLYFGKTVSELTLPECALIAGLIRAPEIYSPFRNLEKAKKRRAYVLDRMLEEKYITKIEAARAKRAPMKLAKYRERRQLFAAAAYYTEQVRRELINNPKYGSIAIYQEGLRIYTPMNAKMQAVAYQALRNHLRYLESLQQQQRNELGRKTNWEIKENAIGLARISKVEPDKNISDAKSVFVEINRKNYRVILPKELPFLDPENILKEGNYIKVRVAGFTGGKPILELVEEPHLEGAIVVLDPYTGEVKALVGGYDFTESQFNRAVQAYRQPGSAFKPIVYAAALDNGWTASDIINDSPVSYRAGNKFWTPHNYDKKYRGPVTLRYALAKSLNVATVRLAHRVGIKKIVEYAHLLGIEDNEDRKINPDLSLALGSCEVTPLELTNAYAVFCNGGRLYTPKFIRTIADHQGKILETFSIETAGNEVLNPETCYLLTEMLKAVITDGTARFAIGQYFKQPIAGKTGTTSDYADAWFIGYTPRLVVGVWIGYDIRKKIGEGMTGAVAAAPVFRAFMQEILKNMPEEDFIAPTDLVVVELCSASHKLATAKCHQAVKALLEDDDPSNDRAIYIYLQAFKKGTEPKEFCTSSHKIPEIISEPEVDEEAPPPSETDQGP